MPQRLNTEEIVNKTRINGDTLPQVVASLLGEFEFFLLIF